MSQSNCVTPQLGLRTATVAIAWMIGVYLLHGQYAERTVAPGMPGVTPAMFSSMLVLGSWYGITAWACWLCTAVPRTFPRLLLRGAAWLIGSYLLDQHQGNEQWLKFMINLGGMLITQSVLFFLLSIPGWKVGGSGRDFETRQFGIGDILLATTGVSVLLGMAIRFQTPIDAEAYWLVLAGLWLLFPLLSACACTAALHRAMFRRVFFLTIGALLVLVGAVGGAACERALAGLSDTDGTRFAVRYGTIMLGNLTVMFLLSLTGRWDARPASRAESQDRGSQETSVASPAEKD
ncbi:MAG: hypothetical protein AAF542_26155 [Pseudomonadota bacterium]